MARKANNQQSTSEKNGSGSAEHAGTESTDLDNLLEADADEDDDDVDDTDDGNDGGGDGDDGDEGSGDVVKRMERLMERKLQEQRDALNAGFQREMDRRINSALGKVRKGQKQDRNDEGNDDGDTSSESRPVVADVRGARLAFRDYLPGEIRFLSPEEKQMATDFGLNLIRAQALKGFDDEDEAGREAAKATAAFLKKARGYYSGRTKKALEKQGVLKQEGSGQTYSSAPNGKVQDAFERAKAKDRQLFPERYANEKK